MSKDTKELLIIWLVALCVALCALVWLNAQVNAMVRLMSVPDYSPTKLVVVDVSPSDIQPVLQADGGSTDIQPALGQKALTWHLTSATQQGLDINKAIKSGGLVWVQ